MQIITSMTPFSYQLLFKMVYQVKYFKERYHVCISSKYNITTHSKAFSPQHSILLYITQEHGFLPFTQTSKTKGRDILDILL